ncbi:hypothetical protein BO71DRAFT_105886 [Aspergillus ellipticus CBS 707.79]|uniref:Uncharacterized protein n=1 Tax=Aspergillus ellipticus CBS 707.79 TaxID=1448320 RepID=A0A319DN59_9EURO|nr:hypothetical protein BO71DRAFT_105886 [Aspergillus ellipticus CBS 707.79]
MGEQQAERRRKKEGTRERQRDNKRESWPKGAAAQKSKILDPSPSSPSSSSSSSSSSLSVITLTLALLPRHPPPSPFFLPPLLPPICT